MVAEGEGAATEEGLGGEDFTIVDGLDVDEPAAMPVADSTPAGAVTDVVTAKRL